MTTPKSDSKFIALNATADDLKYMSGFQNHFETEAVKGALPIGRNSPQKVAYGLYAEQFSGSAFTAPRAKNLRSWLYRILPSVTHGPSSQIFLNFWKTAGAAETGSAAISASAQVPDQMRWDPLEKPAQPTDFLDGIRTMCVGGSVKLHLGCAVHVYSINESMITKYFCNADAEMVIVPELGELILRTEFGLLKLAPGEIATIPRGTRFQVRLLKSWARGYVCENYGQPLTLPELGPIGANGLAASRDFLSPEAWFEDIEGDFQIITKYLGSFFKIPVGHSPLNVVAWHGNHTVFKYDLRKFNTIGTVSFDHPDPSIFTVLTSPSAFPGVANLDFVIFPPRWMVGEDTFRPPYYHRNVMSEFMGLIFGEYDAKPHGFIPGGSSLHNCMAPHGPDLEAFERATHSELGPVKLENTLAFMFESQYAFELTEFAQTAPSRQKDYLKTWDGLKKTFDFKGEL